MSSIDPAEVLYFSEGGEDFFLWSLFEYKSNGVFIDVGAFDGRYLSNSVSFAQAGWRGACVEPVEEFWALCKKNQPNTICIHAACVDDPKIKEVKLNAEPLGVYSRIDLQPGDAAQLRKSYENYGISEEQGFQLVTVPAITLAEIVEDHFRDEVIDFLSIDVEGGELKVLDGLLIEKNRPRVIVAEANDEDGKNDLKSRLQGHGYAYIRQISNNLFFSREDELVERGKQLQIVCAIERHLHPKGLAYTFRGIAMGKIIDEKKDHDLSRQRGRIRQLEDMVVVEKSTTENQEKRIKSLMDHLDTAKKRRDELQNALDLTRQTVTQMEAAAIELEEKALDATETIEAHFLVPRPNWMRKNPKER